MTGPAPTPGAEPAPHSIQATQAVAARREPYVDGAWATVAAVRARGAIEACCLHIVAPSADHAEIA